CLVVSCSAVASSMFPPGRFDGFNRRYPLGLKATSEFPHADYNRRMSGALKRASLVFSTCACLVAAFASGADARIALVADGSKHVVAFDTATNQKVGSPIPTEIGPYGIAITPDARKAYVTNIDAG